MKKILTVLILLFAFIGLNPISVSAWDPANPDSPDWTWDLGKVTCKGKPVPGVKVSVIYRPISLDINGQQQDWCYASPGPRCGVDADWTACQWAFFTTTADGIIHRDASVTNPANDVFKEAWHNPPVIAVMPQESFDMASDILCDKCSPTTCITKSFTYAPQSSLSALDGCFINEQPVVNTPWFYNEHDAMAYRNEADKSTAGCVATGYYDCRRNVPCSCDFKFKEKIGGTVRNRASGGPVAGAIMTLYHNGDPTGVSTYTTTTASDGSYYFNHAVPTGHFYGVRSDVVPSGYLSPYRTTETGWTWDNGINSDTPLNSDSYDSQRKGFADCGSVPATAPVSQQIVHCDFNLDPDLTVPTATPIPPTTALPSNFPTSVPVPVRSNWRDTYHCVAEGDIATIACIQPAMQNMIDFLVAFSTAVALIFMLIAGIKYITAGGDKEKIESAKRTLTYALIGLLIITLSFVIVRIIAYLTGVSGVLYQ